MRIAIGDIHGRAFWKEHIGENYTEYYILGDYFDSYDIPFVVQLDNYYQIVEAARQDSRIKLCMGNHDYHYFLKDPAEQYSGFQRGHAKEIYDALVKNIELLKIVYIANKNILISHAGVSNTFMKDNSFENIDEVNAAFVTQPELFRFNGWEPYGDEVQQGPLWIRPRSLLKDAYSGYSQIVGHTITKYIITEHIQKMESELGVRTITFIDTHDKKCIHRF
ncbi:MAG: metallophosphoesterase [Spirochaetaceae bacterium]|jgi:hypothetical protein|nr:metallophosphoesterase [Spirochaetaceae bacterium]